MRQAVDLVVDKSEGQFIYSKYVFDELAKRPGAWSLVQLGELAPGLYGVFKYIMDMVQVRIKR